MQTSYESEKYASKTPVELDRGSTSPEKTL